ncbi:TPA: hypothetical protein ACXDAY_002489 [Clostridium botulinum]|uniref:hypothetical protein n=1 Tax=Clostridium botulinum TaxID=1491 RepID=UPI00035BB1F4|nr:hypothetical protein [Clostridium botulinum]EPS56244.1 phage integrase family protein [Clostridium botulinum Af84]MBN3350519.1 hypothetical protein [Clostridium botulinum]MBN3357555.1 hypothetical protein [Clostridium botulinum]NFP13267.1 hypothetical protein [Clostridium botulinum]NFR30461.1 hypothetical protein [Clostridium botulinum]
MSNKILVINKNETVYDESKVLYEYDFNWLKNKNIIKNESFNDEIWIIKYYNYNAYCRFNKVNYINFKDALKVFLIEELKNYYDTNYSVKNINLIIKIINLTEGFNIKYIKSIKLKFASNKVISKSAISNACVKFLSFLNKAEYGVYLNFFKQYTKKVSNIRELPDYQSIIEFDYLLDKYFLDSKNKINKYFPILLWWRITSVIPIRPIEFLTLEKNCCYKENDDYYIIINRRNKDKNNNQNKGKQQKLRLNNELYMLIKKYNEIVELNCKSIQNNRKYLLSYELYKDNLQKPNLSLNLKSNKSFLEMRQLQKLLTDFYDKVIYAKYNMKIKRIKLGDTRHLAFCNLMLQGLDPITIAEIGFHKKLSTQIIYEKHLDTFIYSYTYILANKIKDIKIKSSLEEINNIINRDEIILRSKLFGDDKDKYIKIGNGYCMDYKFPLNCGNIDCIDCSYYILSDINSENIKDLNKKINSQLLKVKEDLISMRYLAKKVMYIKNSELFEENKNRLLFMSNNLQREIVKNANMIAQL